MNIKEIKQKNFGKVIESPSMREYTTYKVGGNASLLISPKNEEKLLDLLHYTKENHIKYKVLGNGSNLIFSDEGFDGIIIKLDEFDHLKIKENDIMVGAGYNLMRLSLKLSRSGYTGLEFASGIPGSVGGAVYMNAGAYKSDMGYVVRSARVVTPSLNIITMSNKELAFHYRTSFLKENPGYICIEATLRLPYGNAKESMELISERKKRRVESQPLSYPSAGSVFRNPEGTSAWKLIDDLGFKGKRYGGAMVSDMHANFIVNDGGAKASDIKHLIMEIKDKVREVYGIELKEEQEFVDR